MSKAPDQTQPTTDEVVRRHFGRNHDKPCKRPSVLTCALWECQKANECRWGEAGPDWRNDPLENTSPVRGYRPQITINGTRWVERFREALASPTRDDGSLKSEPRKQ